VRNHPLSTPNPPYVSIAKIIGIKKNSPKGVLEIRSGFSSAPGLSPNKNISNNKRFVKVLYRVFYRETQNKEMAK